MARYLFVGMVAMLAALSITAAPAQAAPQCQYGPGVTADCPPGGCVDGVLGQASPCTGPLLEPLLLEGPPVRVEFGVGSG